MDDGPHWDIEVYDAALIRARKLLVAVPENRVVLIPPPGEGLLIPTHSVRVLCEALESANGLAQNRNGGQAWP